MDLEKELLKRIVKLENRVDELEKMLSTGSKNKKCLMIKNRLLCKDEIDTFYYKTIEDYNYYEDYNYFFEGEFKYILVVKLKNSKELKFFYDVGKCYQNKYYSSETEEEFYNNVRKCQREQKRKLFEDISKLETLINS